MTPDNINNRIYEVRGMKVMLDRDLAALYEVTTGNLNKAVARNPERFPEDFMFQLTRDEWENLWFQMRNAETAEQRSRFQNGTLKAEILTNNTRLTARGHNMKYLPYAFTEQGVAMLSGVLRSERAVKVNIAIMRAFVAVRRAIPLMATRKDIDDLKSRIRSLEAASAGTQDNIDGIHDELRRIFNAIDSLASTPQEPLPPIGYKAIEERWKKEDGE